jgi:hypothetical protein
MRDDLLHAQASVDWAESNLPILKQRLDAWLKDNIHVVIKELPDDTPNNVVVAIQKCPLPVAFQVEAGANINAIRSSLDILACALANRHCQALIDETYFPIVSDASILARGITNGKGFKGAKFIQALPAKERGIIETLKPYKGGNDLLWPLHQLDIVRKHQRLLTTEVRPRTFAVFAWGDISKVFTPIATGWIPGGDDEAAVLGLTPKGQKPQIKLTMQVSLGEAAYLPHREIVTALYEFANLAKAIIRDFDY